MSKLPTEHLKDLQNKDFFDKWSKNYDTKRISPWFQYTQKLTIQTLSLRDDSKILDVGCGTGHAVFSIAALAPKGLACGIDISRGMIEQARSKVPQDWSHRVEFREAGSDDIPYPDGFFDGLICTNSFHHYPDPLKALKEMQRVLKSGGELVIFENARELSWYVWLWDRLLRAFEKGHVCYYSSRELGDLLHSSGLSNPKLCHLRNEFMKHGKLFASIQVWRGQKPTHGVEG